MSGVELFKVTTDTYNHNSYFCDFSGGGGGGSDPCPPSEYAHGTDSSLESHFTTMG